MLYLHDIQTWIILAVRLYSLQFSVECHNYLKDDEVTSFLSFFLRLFQNYLKEFYEIFKYSLIE